MPSTIWKLPGGSHNCNLEKEPSRRVGRGNFRRDSARGERVEEEEEGAERREREGERELFFRLN